jgi:hypothetical protein
MKVKLFHAGYSIFSEAQNGDFESAKLETQELAVPPRAEYFARCKTWDIIGFGLEVARPRGRF